MNKQKFSLDLREDTFITRISNLIFGLFCLAVSLWFIIKLGKEPSSTTSAWIAVAFLSLFGIWELLAGFGMTSRYITIDKNIIIIRHRFYSSPVSLLPAMIKEIEFKPLAISFHLHEGKDILLRLGAYYKERSADIMKSVEVFCTENNIKTEGLTENT